jgi:AcrR family transcriptional regulator
MGFGQLFARAWRMKRAPTPARRTQRERREATIAKLVEATIASILEVGYARTSVVEICRRAGVSHGGLFRHFGSLVDLVIAAGEEVARRQMASFQERFSALEDSDDPLRAALYLLRDGARAPINVVFYELLVAARTDADLHRAFAPFCARYANAIAAAALAIPGARRWPLDELAVLVSSAVHLFDGEALVRTLLPMPELEERRMQLLVDFLPRRR